MPLWTGAFRGRSACGSTLLSNMDIVQIWTNATPCPARITNGGQEFESRSGAPLPNKSEHSNLTSNLTHRPGLTAGTEVLFLGTREGKRRKARLRSDPCRHRSGPGEDYIVLNKTGEHASVGTNARATARAPSVRDPTPLGLRPGSPLGDVVNRLQSAKPTFGVRRREVPNDRRGNSALRRRARHDSNV